VEEFLDDREAIEPRHLHVEKNQVGIVFADQVHGFQAVLPLGNDFDVADILQQERELVARELFVIHDYCRKGHTSPGMASRKVYSRLGFRLSALQPAEKRTK